MNADTYTAIINMSNDKPRIFAEFDFTTTLDTVPTVEVAGNKLRAGMVLVDQFNTPSAGIDHRVRSTRGSGDATFLAYDFDRRSITTLRLSPRRTYRVVAG